MREEVLATRVLPTGKAIAYETHEWHENRVFVILRAAKNPVFPRITWTNRRQGYGWQVDADD